MVEESQKWVQHVIEQVFYSFLPLCMCQLLPA
jgi:hypothetical protein